MLLSYFQYRDPIFDSTEYAGHVFSYLNNGNSMFSRTEFRPTPAMCHKLIVSCTENAFACSRVVCCVLNIVDVSCVGAYPIISHLGPT